jgi:hypothetical protein
VDRAANRRSRKKVEAVQSDASSDESSLLIRTVLAYLVKHPDAKDTAGGIYQFWLSGQTAHHGREKVREVLDFLVEERGWLTAKAVGRWLILYGLNKDRIDEIRNFLGDL